MKEGEHLTKHEKDFDQIIEKLTKLGVKMGEEQITLMFLASLPNSFADALESVIHAKMMLTLAEAREEWRRIKAENVKTWEGEEERGAALGTSLLPITKGREYWNADERIRKGDTGRSVAAFDNFINKIGLLDLPLAVQNTHGVVIEMI
ncbi:Uncharacterized protein TCM_045182 [Theobroma cacao]|uniref:Uncharacterized protein n=1 Tax=Theobroma cacao TaxID=3641 RepID=A0A061FYF0_THECC|nr:Uncharacterized protein TCM_045182 [Theobroma cacao]